MLFAFSAFRHDGLMKAVPEGFWELKELIVPVDLDGPLRGVHHHMAFVAPMQMLVQFRLKALIGITVEIIR